MITSLDVLAVGGRAGREGRVKQNLATQCAYSLREIPTHACLRCQRTQLTIVTELSRARASSDRHEYLLIQTERETVGIQSTETKIKTMVPTDHWVLYTTKNKILLDVPFSRIQCIC